MLGSLTRLVPELFPNSSFASLEEPLALLLASYELAREFGSSFEESAVALPVLRQAGLSYLDLQWLIRNSYVVHAQARQLSTEDTFAPKRVALCSAPVSVAISLTDLGALYARWSLLRTDGPFLAEPDDLCASDTEPPASPLPHWDWERKELRLGSILVKRFRRPAPNQELILDSFEEEGWPRRIDDPLPQQANQDAKERLHDAIKGLNRYRSQPLLRFQGDGTGCGIRWEMLRRSSPDRP